MDTLEFKTRPRSICGVDMWHRGDKHVILVTELEDNKGTSITNSWPELADIICKKFDLLPYDEIVWVEHYSDPESWDLVFLIWNENKFKFNLSLTEIRHPWQSISESRFNSLINQL